MLKVNRPEILDIEAGIDFQEDDGGIRIDVQEGGGWIDFQADDGGWIDFQADDDDGGWIDFQADDDDGGWIDFQADDGGWIEFRNSEIPWWQGLEIFQSPSYECQICRLQKFRWCDSSLSFLCFECGEPTHSIV